MSKKKAGQFLPELKGVTIENKPINLEDYKGAPLILSFYRYAACPFCNLRMHEFIKKYQSEYLPAGAKAIAVFQSPISSMEKYLDEHQAVFELVSDPKMKWYKSMGVTTSWAGFMAGAMNVSQAVSATQKGMMRIDPEGPVNRLPADFLVNNDGSIYRAYYGKNISDHIPFEEISEWLNP